MGLGVNPASFVLSPPLPSSAAGAGDAGMPGAACPGPASTAAGSYNLDSCHRPHPLVHFPTPDVTHATLYLLRFEAVAFVVLIAYIIYSSKL